MTVTALLIWILVGLVAGWLASLVMGRGFGIIGDIIIGVLGAFVGSYLFRSLGLKIPLKGIPGTILVAFAGALVLLLVLRVLGAAFRR